MNDGARALLNATPGGRSMHKLIFSIAAASAIAGAALPSYAEESPKQACAAKPEAAPSAREIKDWEEGEPIPSGYHTRVRPSSRLVAAGASIFGSLYVLSAIVASDGVGKCNTRGCHDASLLFIPLVGPFARMGVGKNNISSEVMLGLDGVVQLASAALLYAGVTSTTLVLKKDLASGAPRLTLKPYVLGTSAGVRGAF
jgi:hypothetical protein